MQSRYARLKLKLLIDRLH